MEADAIPDFYPPWPRSAAASKSLEPQEGQNKTKNSRAARGLRGHVGNFATLKVLVVVNLGCIWRPTVVI